MREGLVEYIPYKLFTVEDIVAAAVEGVETVVHDMSAGGPGSGRHKEQQIAYDWREHLWNRGGMTRLAQRAVKGGDLHDLHPGKITVYRGTDTGSKSHASSGTSWTTSKAQAKRYGNNIHTMSIDEHTPAIDVNMLLKGIPSPSQKDREIFIAPIKNLQASANKAIYPDDHKAGMKVPKGGSSCAVCEYLKAPHTCGNEYFIKWNGSNKFEPEDDEYCCDWFEASKKLEAASEQSFEDQQKGTLWNGIKIIGFTGPEEEGLRSMLSRIPPELLFNVKEIKAAPELNAKHGKFDDATKTVSFNPSNFKLRQRFGKGDGWISHPELTAVHEIGHSIYRTFTPEQQQEWKDISGWMQGWKPGQSPAYQESRPGWGNAVSSVTHKAGVKFTRHYSERNDDEDFADSFAFVILGHGHQMEPAKKDFIDNYIKANVHTYPQVNIASPIKANAFPYNILGGGPGSGEYIHKKGPGKPLSDRAQRAAASYVAQTKGKSQIARLNEVLVAKYVKGETTGDNKPFDVLTKKVGIEVKTIFPGVKNEKITMHPESLARKLKAQKELKVKTWTVVVDMRNKLDTYIKPSLGSFRLGSMQKISSIKDLGKYIR